MMGYNNINMNGMGNMNMNMNGQQMGPLYHFLQNQQNGGYNMYQNHRGY